MKSERLKELIISSEKILETEAIKEIEHYYKHGEYEMAFEGLLIELTQISKYPKGFNFLDWKELGEEYRLNKQPIFDESIWVKFFYFEPSEPIPIYPLAIDVYPIPQKVEQMLISACQKPNYQTVEL